MVEVEVGEVGSESGDPRPGQRYVFNAQFAVCMGTELGPFNRSKCEVSGRSGSTYGVVDGSSLQLVRRR